VLHLHKCIHVQMLFGSKRFANSFTKSGFRCCFMTRLLGM